MTETATPAGPAAEIAVLMDGPVDAHRIVAFAHGASVAMDSPFMRFFAEGLGARGIKVVRFEFPYMTMQRRDGLRRPPGPSKVIMETWRSIVARLPTERLVLAGKSMGGRTASLIADDAGVRGLVCLGYPFHPARRPETRRFDHLADLRTPTLILQGERDPFGTRAEVDTYGLAPAIRVHWIVDGDHSFVPRKSSARTTETNWAAALDAFSNFVDATVL